MFFNRSFETPQCRRWRWFLLLTAAACVPGTMHAAPSEVHIFNSVVFGPDSTLEIELAGASAGPPTQYDRLIIAGTAALGGTLDVTLLDGFAPQVGHTFEIFTAAGGLSGAFSGVVLPSLAAGLNWDLAYQPTAVTLGVLAPGPEETTWTGSVDGDWNKAGNWSGGVPRGNKAFIGAGTTVATSANPPSFQRLNLQNTTGLLTIGHAVTLQRLDDNHETLVGNGTSGNLRIITGGSLTLTGDGSGELLSLHGYSAVSTVTVDGGSLTTTDASQAFRLGGPVSSENGATFTLNSGAVDIAGPIRVGRSGGVRSKGVMNLNGGTFTYGGSFVVEGNSGIGPAGGGNLNINGATVLGTGTGRHFVVAANTVTGDYGQVTLASGSLELGLDTTMTVGPGGSFQAPPSSGRFVIAGGDFYAPGEQTLVQINSAAFPNGIPTANHGSLHQSGGTAHIEGELRIGRGLPSSTTSGAGSYVHRGGEMTVSNSSGTGLLRVAIRSELSITGGTITADEIQIDAGPGPGRLRGNGGTLVGPVDIAGVLSPGFSSGLPPPHGVIPGMLNIHGDLTLASTAETIFNFKDPTLATRTFDSILNDGTDAVLFGGALTLRFFGGEYQPGTVAVFRNFASYSGDFDSLTVTGLTNGETVTFDPANGTLTIAAEMLPADFNGDGSVDAADYIVWRKTDGSPEAYNTWRTNFGRTAGSDSDVIVNTAIPEPATTAILIMAVAGWCLRRARAL